MKKYVLMFHMMPNYVFLMKCMSFNPIMGPIHFRLYGFLGGNISLNSNFKRTFCKLKVATLIRRYVTCFLIWVSAVAYVP